MKAFATVGFVLVLIGLSTWLTLAYVRKAMIQTMAVPSQPEARTFLSASPDTYVRPTPGADASSGWRLFTNSDHDYTIMVPPGWTARQGEPAGTSTDVTVSKYSTRPFEISIASVPNQPVRSAIQL